MYQSWLGTEFHSTMLCAENNFDQSVAYGNFVAVFVVIHFHSLILLEGVAISV